MFYLVSLVSSLPCWRPLRHAVLYYSHMLSCLTTCIEFFPSPSKIFCLYCCDVIRFIRTATVPWAWSFPCWSVVTVVCWMLLTWLSAFGKRNRLSVYQLPMDSRLRGCPLTFARVQLKKTSSILTNFTSPVWYLGLSLASLAVVLPVQDGPISAVHFRQLLLKINFVDLIIYLGHLWLQYMHILWHFCHAVAVGGN
jgi:hypothetical protein